MGFNRAALFLLDERRQFLEASFGIGHLDLDEARDDWKDREPDKPRTFDNYLRHLMAGDLQDTPVGEALRGLRCRLDRDLRDVFSQVVLAKKIPTIVKQNELEALPDEFRRKFLPSYPLVVVPLKVRDEVIGLLVADNKFTGSPVTEDDVESLSTLANTAASAIDKTRLLHQTEKDRQHLRLLYEASSDLVSGQNPEEVQENILKKLLGIAGATRARWYVLDEQGHPLSPPLTVGGLFDKKPKIRPDGISIHVRRTGEPVVIENIDQPGPYTLNPLLVASGVRAAVCLPLSLQGKSIGVIWLHYDTPHHFSEAEIQNFQLYVNQAVLAYDAARRLEALHHMQQAAADMAKATDIQTILKQIVESARVVLQQQFPESDKTR